METENKPVTPSTIDPSSESTNGFAWTRSRSWLIPGGLLVLCLVTAAFFFLAAKHKYTATTVTANEPEASQGGVFRFPIWERPIQTLDPARANTASEIMLIQQIYEGLTAFDQHLNIVPALARYWEISPDGKTYTFELRPDALFHNGAPVTAEDCVFSFERLLTPGLNETNYHYLMRVVGAQDFREGKAKTVAGLRAIDERTFQIRFTTPFVPALSVLSMYSSKILPKKEVLKRGEHFFKEPIGAGPFRFSRWTSRAEDPAIPFFREVPQGIRLDANPHYFEGRPHLGAVVFRAIWNARDAKEEKPLNQLVDCIEAPIDRYYDWVGVETDKLLRLNYYYFPTKVAPYDDPRVRRAINYALNKRALLDASHFTAGTPAATGIVPPGIPGFFPMGASWGHNVDKAKKILAKAGYPQRSKLPPIKTLVFGREGSRTAARRECITSCLSKIGIEVQPHKVRRLVPLSDPVFEKSPFLLYAGWIADFPDPDNFLRVLFHSTSPVNRSGYNNPEIDSLLDLAWSETSYKERNDLYRRIEKMILHDSPIIPLDYDRSRFLVRPNVRGFSLSPMGYTYIKMNKIWLDPSATQESRPKDL